MKTKLFILSAGVAFAISLFGCASVSPTELTRIATVSEQAARIGTSEVLTAHPEWRPQFQQAADELHALAASPNISVETLLQIAQRLPVKELKSNTARLSFEGATLLISAIDVPELPADRVAQLQPIAQAIADGILGGIALAPSPAPKATLPPPVIPVPTVQPGTNQFIPPTSNTLSLPGN